MDVDEAMDVSTINRLLQDVVQAERTLHRELFDTVVKKEQISQRLTSHQVRFHLLRGVDSLLLFLLCVWENRVLKKSISPPSFIVRVVQKSVAVLGSVQSESKRLHSDILEMSALANVVSDQV